MSRIKKRVFLPAFLLMLLLLPVLSYADGAARADDPDMIDISEIDGSGIVYDYAEAQYRGFVYNEGITADIYFPVRRGLIYHGPDAVITKMTCSENIMSEAGSVMYEIKCEADTLALARLRMQLELKEADIAHEREQRNETAAELWKSYYEAAAASAAEAELINLSLQEFQVNCELSDLQTEKELKKLREDIAYQESLQETDSIKAPCNCFLVKSYSEIGRTIRDGDLICLISEAVRPIMKCTAFTPPAGIALQYKPRSGDNMVGKVVVSGLDYPSKDKNPASYCRISSFSSDLWNKTMKSRGTMQSVPALVQVDPAMVQRENILSIPSTGFNSRLDTSRSLIYTVSVVNEEYSVQKRTVRIGEVFTDGEETYAWIISGLYEGDRVATGLSDYSNRPTIHVEFGY